VLLNGRSCYRLQQNASRNSIGKAMQPSQEDMIGHNACLDFHFSLVILIINLIICW